MNYKYTQFLRRFVIAGVVSTAITLLLFASTTLGLAKLCFTSLIYAFIYSSVGHFVPILAEPFLEKLERSLRKTALFAALTLASVLATFAGEFITTSTNLVPESRLVLWVLLLVGGFILPLLKSLKWKFSGE